MLKEPMTWVCFMIGAVGALTAKMMFYNQGAPYEMTKDLPEIFHLIDIAYVDDVDMDALMPGVFQGALERLDDNASYVPPGVDPALAPDKLFDQTGMVVAKHRGYAYVVAVANQSPAFEIGLRPGDYIQEIDGKSTRKMSFFQIHALLAERDPIQLKIVKPNKIDPVEKKLEPHPFKIPHFEHVSYADGVHLFRIPHFYPSLKQDLTKSFAEIEDPDHKIVLDLRNNAIGGEHDLRLLASFFLPAGKIASWTNAKQDTVDIMNPTAGSYLKRALYIILDESTSNAAEMFGAAAQDGKNAVILGKASLGYPSRYQAFPLESGGSVILPTHVFKLKSGKNLTKKGVKPDFEIKLSEVKEQEDLLLQKALERVRAAELKKAS